MCNIVQLDLNILLNVRIVASVSGQKKIQYTMFLSLSQNFAFRYKCSASLGAVATSCEHTDTSTQKLI